MSTAVSALRSPPISQDVGGGVLDSSSAKRSNALSNKLTSVLSSSYTDTEIRDALRLFDVRYSQTDVDEDLDLKYETQKEVIEANGRIIDDFSKVAKQLTRVGTLIATLNQTCDEIRKHVLAAKEETAPMLEEASLLFAQKQETEQKQQLLDSFCSHFLLSDEDLTTLTSSADPVDERFFQVLARVKQIHKDCELLLGYENQRLGLEMLEQTTYNLNAGYKKLFNWTLREFKGLDLEDPHISGSIRRSLRALSERPALFQNCLDSFAEARQSTLSEAFQKALTDSTMGTARAIEFSTHDPLRYIGDMLAWVHSATVSEMEALEGLFISDADEISRGLHEGKATDPFAMPTEGEDRDMPFDGHAALNSLISRNMASVAYTLIQRISVTIRNLSDPVDIYKAYNVLSFYHDMFLKLIKYSADVDTESLQDNSILSTLTGLQSTTFKHFEATALEKLHSSIDEEPNSDLTPPSALAETLASFRIILLTRGPALTLQEFQKLYQTLVAPILSSCTDLAALAAESPNATTATPLIYKLNCMSLVRGILSSLASGSANSRIEAASEPLGHADNEIVLLRTSLIELLSQTFLGSSGLTELHQLFSESTTSTSSGHSATLRRKHLVQAASATTGNAEHVGQRLEALAHRLDGFLASALMDTQDDLGKLTDREIAQHVIKAAATIFCEKFEDVVVELEDLDEEIEREALARRMGKGRVDDGVNGTGKDGQNKEEGGHEQDYGGYEDEGMAKLREIYPRTVEEVQALLS